MSALIQTTLNDGGYEVTADTGAVRDDESLFVSRKQTITFRGSESALAEEFPAGATNYPAPGQPRMLCSGPQNVQLVEATAANPHYDAEITWIGLHTAYEPPAFNGWRAIGGDAEFVWRVEDEFNRAETRLPIEAKNKDTGASIWTFAPVPIVPELTNDAGGYTRSRLIHFIPSRKITGIILSDIPVTPFHPKIKIMIASWGKDPPNKNELVQNWDALADPMYTYCKGYSESAVANGGLDGSWIPGPLQTRRQLSAGNLRAFTLDVIWEQRKTPG